MIKLGGSVKVARRETLDLQIGITVAHAPYLGFVAIKSGKGTGLNLLAPPGDDIDHLNMLSDISNIVNPASKRGYFKSIVFGPTGEKSAAAAMSGALCLMPCHWAAYAAAISKFTPLATYFAKPSCCSHEPSVYAQLTGCGLDVVFYGTIAMLATGAVRRVLRQKKTKKLLTSIDDCVGELGQTQERLPFCVVEEKGYERIEKTAGSHGLSELLSERARQEYRRPSEGLLGKTLDPIMNGLRRAKMTISSKQYRDLGKLISKAYNALACTAKELSHDREDGIKSVIAVLAQGYAREAASYENPVSPKGLCIKLVNYARGFSYNHNWYRA